MSTRRARTLANPQITMRLHFAQSSLHTFLRVSRFCMQSATSSRSISTTRLICWMDTWRPRGQNWMFGQSPLAWILHRLSTTACQCGQSASKQANPSRHFCVFHISARTGMGRMRLALFRGSRVYVRGRGFWGYRLP